MGEYHNGCVWPWVTAEYVALKAKIAREHPDPAVRDRYRGEAVRDLADLARLFEGAGGAWEVFDPETRGPALRLRMGLRRYVPPRDFLGSLAGFAGVCLRLKALGWV